MADAPTVRSGEDATGLPSEAAMSMPTVTRDPEQGTGGEPPQGRTRRVLAATLTLAAGGATLVVGSARWFGLDVIDVLTGTLLLGIGVTAFALPRASAVAAAATLVVVWLLGYVIYDQVPRLLDAGIPVQDAVGAAAYFNVPYLGRQLAGALLLLLVLVVGCVGIRASGRARRLVSTGPPSLAPSPRRTRRLTVLGGALIAVTLLPDLNEVLIDAWRSPVAQGWDVANTVTWDYLLQQGLRPMHDFWYPYGGLWLFQDFPTGPAALFAWQVCVIALAGWSLWRLVGRPARLLLCLLALAGVGLLDPPTIDHIPAFWRYIPGFVLPVVYAAVGPLRHSRLTSGHLVLAVTCAAIALLATDVFLIGLGGALFVAIGELVFEPSRRWRPAIRSLAVDVIPILAGVACMLLVWALSGTLEENVHWFGEVRSVSAFTAAQKHFTALDGLSADPSLTTALAILPALILAAAFWHRHVAGEPGTATSKVLFAASGATALILAKHLVRPQGVIVLLIPLVALLWTAIILWRRQPLSSAVAGGLFAGAFLAFMQTGATVKPSRYILDAVATPLRAVRDVGVILDQGRLHAAAIERFSVSRFAELPEKKFIADPLAGALSGTGASRFAVLGDAQILYVLFNQRPPDHIALYNASQRSEQREMIDALRKMKPARLVWRRDVNIDGVPYWVRNPLVFAYAIQHYVPELQAAPMDLLRRRQPGEPVALGFWRDRLGPTMELGAIPSYSRATGHDRCRGARNCVSYAIVSGKATSGGRKVMVEVAGRGGPYGISFTTRRGVDEYAVRLDRLWFWRLIEGPAVRLTSATPGWTVRRTSLHAGDDLY